VRAVAAGRVAFAGPVAGTVYVVVELANGWRITYGNLADLTIGRGDAVAAGVLLGHTAGNFHFGLRSDAGADVYLDPTPHLGVWRHRVRLIPADGTPAAPAPEPTLHCPAPGAAASTGR
jgi:murein DD-endopeptidase MepM/ murein hydrolase activator NlpD